MRTAVSSPSVRTWRAAAGACRRLNRFSNGPRPARRLNAPVRTACRSRRSSGGSRWAPTVVWPPRRTAVRRRLTSSCWSSRWQPTRRRDWALGAPRYELLGRTEKPVGGRAPFAKFVDLISEVCGTQQPAAPTPTTMKSNASGSAVADVMAVSSCVVPRRHAPRPPGPQWPRGSQSVTGWHRRRERRWSRRQLGFVATHPYGQRRRHTADERNEERLTRPSL